MTSISNQISPIARKLITVATIVAFVLGGAIGHSIKPTTVIRYDQPPPPEVTGEGETIEKRLENLELGQSGLTTLIYGAIGAALVSALASIVSLMQISRQIGN